METQTQKFSWRNENELMARLTKAQNRLADIDIMTFAAFCDSREELESHVVRYETEAGIVH